MKNLIYKELKLVIQPAAYLFALLSGMLLIPAYPYCVGVSYFIIAISVTFSVSRANNDHLFTAMLPVPRNHIVLAKHFTVMITEIVQLLAAIPFALISALILNKNGNIVGMDSNFAFFGLILIAYSIFNIIFLPLYFKTGYKTGVPLFTASSFYIIFIMLYEIIIALIPALKSNLDSLDSRTFVYQIPLLVIGMVIYAAGICLSYKLSVKNFDKVSL